MKIILQPSGTSKLVYTISDLNANLRTHGCQPTTCFLTLSLMGAPDNFVLPAKLKDSTVNSAHVQVSEILPLHCELIKGKNR